MNQGERRSTKKLTAAKINGNLAAGKYHDGGGTGLFLRVEPNGSRRWLQRTTINGKRREIGLGSPPSVSLAAARESASKNKRDIKEGLNPLSKKRDNTPTLTFMEAANLYLEVKSSEFTNKKHKSQWFSTLNTYAYPLRHRRQSKRSEHG